MFRTKKVTGWQDSIMLTAVQVWHRAVTHNNKLHQEGDKLSTPTPFFMHHQQQATVVLICWCSMA